jgi:hypothetical protein
MQRRLEQLGGSLSHGPLGDDGFVVRAQVPVPVGVA